MSTTGLPPLIGQAVCHGERLAIIDDRSHVSYVDLLSRARQVAACLLEGKRDLHEARVTFLVSPGIEYVAVLLGIWWAGGVAVPLGLQYPPAEIEYFLDDAGPERFIVDARFEGPMRPLAAARNIGFLRSDRLKSSTEPSLPELSSERRAMILYTSGATSRPKGVVATHRNITAQISSLIAAWDWSSDDHVLQVLPLHHVHGIINVLCCSLWAGATCEILPKFEASRVLDIFAGSRISVFMAVPTIYVKLIIAWDALGESARAAVSEACSRMRLMVSGSAALPVDVSEKWQKISGHLLLERYGMTEIGMALSNPLHGLRKPGAVGFPLPGIEVKLVDDSGRVIAKEGVPGEIWVRGESVFKEYWQQPEATANAFRSGWFRTGDIAVVEAGYYRILGRSSVDIIKTGGYKVSALEIEEVLRRHPSISECAVVGIEDPEWGERVSAVAVLYPGRSLQLEELRSWATDRLAKYKIPSRLLVVEELPRNPMGKVRKPEVKKLFQAEKQI